MKRNLLILQNAGMIVRAATFMLLLFLAQSLAAQVGAVYYVSTTGNDSNPGTLAAPWLTIQHAASTATAGATVNVIGGVYNEIVNFPNSGLAGEPITFQSDPVVVGTSVQGAVIDGTDLTVSGTQGLITISGTLSYITVKGFEIRNLSSSKGVPCGVWITGSGTGVQILNNIIHDIATTAKNGNACGLFAYGTSQTPISNLIVSGNELYNLRTGESESMTLNGNVTHFQITNNLVHDNNNIGIDIIGYERTGPTGYDQAGWGVVSGNTVYNISGIGNPGEDAEYDADGLYCDGCAYVTFERNVVMQVDYGIETTSENQRCLASGNEWPTGVVGVGTPATGTYPCYGMNVTVRNNLFYYENACGNSIGGYALATTKGGGSNGGGSSYHDVFVNNTLFDNGTQPGNDSEGTPSGDFQIQYQVGNAQGDFFENNLIYESAASPYSTSPNMWINSYVPFTQAYPLSLIYPPPPATLNWNLYDSAAGYLEGTSILWGDVATYPDFATWQTTSGEDANSVNADPEFVDLGDAPVNLETISSSPAVGAGSTSLPCSVGWCDPDGSSPGSIYGATDILGNPRTKSSRIDIGAYQNTGKEVSNSLSVNLAVEASTLTYGQATTLTATVTAVPAGGGTPSGTVSIMSGNTLLETAILLPAGVNSSAASMPLSASQLAAGNNTLTAVYSGNAIAPCCTPSEPPAGTQTPVPVYPSATSAPIIVNETQSNQTITITAPAPPTAINNSSFTVVASASSGLPITFGSAGACSNNGATYTMTSAKVGNACTITMSQPGNSNYTAAPTVTETTTVAGAILPMVSVTVPAAAAYQSTYTVVATTNASTIPTLTVAPATVCTISGATVTMIKGTGTCKVTAEWASDDVYKAASATGQTAAEKVVSVVTWATPSPITYGTALSATQLDATANGIPGTFVYTPASGKVLAAGTQSLSVKFTPTDTTDYTTVTSTAVALVINPATTTTTITGVTPDPSNVGKVVTVDFTVGPGNPGGSVTVSASSGEACTGTLSGGGGHCKLGLGTAGSITLTATYTGDANDNGSVSAGFTQAVN
ncbi:MAG: Ig-like domain repeat protein [Terracidiphilus sp.]